TIILDTRTYSSSLLSISITATDDFYTLSLHDALPILLGIAVIFVCFMLVCNAIMQAHRLVTIPMVTTVIGCLFKLPINYILVGRSEEYTSELQSRFDLVCRLLLEKKKKI